MGLSIYQATDKARAEWEVSVPSRGNGVIDAKKFSRLLSLTTSFRPLSGKWGYRSCHDNTIEYRLCKVSVPSRGNGVIDKAWCIMETILNKVSVPSRGNGVIDLTAPLLTMTASSTSFRPLSGKWGYRSQVVMYYPGKTCQSFRPLSGKWGYRSHDGAYARIGRYMFPSPLGEMGLSIWGLQSRAAVSMNSFRPLSGKWGYRYLETSFVMENLTDSFRPLSGKWGYR